MSQNLPTSLLGTTRVRAAERAGFGNLLEAAAGDGRGCLLTEGGTWVWESLRNNGRWRHWDVCALVPHVAGYVREATDYGMFGAGLRRLLRMNLSSWIRLGVHGVRHARGVLRRDFPTLLGLLLEMEMANFRRAQPPVVFLHAQITDLLLATDHGLALERAVRQIRRGFGAEPGLATNNLGTLLPRLQDWSIEVPYVLAPMHSRGYGMRPDQKACEEAIRTYPGKLIATAETGMDSSVVAYWRAHQVAGSVYDVSEPTLAEWRQWQAWSKPATNQAAAESANRELMEVG